LWSVIERDREVNRQVPNNMMSATIAEVQVVLRTWVSRERFPKEAKFKLKSKG
jgi:hypothetical protein